jgi:putative oxidoreductase
MALSLGNIRAAWAALPLELAVGAIMFAHGLPKLLNAGGFAERALGGIPLFLAYLVIAAELGGGILLLAGLLVRLGALGHLCVMAVAVTQVHWSDGLTGPGGFEFPLALLAASISLLIIGSDPLSIDQNVGVSANRSREAGFRRDNIDVASLSVKAAGTLLIAAGILITVARGYIGIPDGTVPFIISLLATLVSVAAGLALVAGKPWAYTPAFIVARLYLAAAVLMLFWLKYTVRGAVAVIIGLMMVAALRSARRGAANAVNR